MCFLFAGEQIEVNEISILKNYSNGKKHRIAARIGRAGRARYCCDTSNYRQLIHPYN
jgi:hypothetical protein